MDEKTLGKKLQLARKRAGLTQQELCQKAGLSYSTLAKIERGAIKSPSVFTVASIAQATGTALESLLGMKTAAAPALSSKKRSKSGVRFVYFDVNGTIVRFFEKAFAKISHDSGHPIEEIETLFWRHDGPACRGEESNEEVNKIFAKQLGLKDFDWLEYYLASCEATPGASDLLRWTSENYEIGLLSNNWSGFTQALMDKGMIPELPYVAVVESAKQRCAKPDPRIYQAAQELAGVKADEILFVDDNQAYLREADQLGWHALWFNGFTPDDSTARVRKALEF